MSRLGVSLALWQTTAFSGGESWCGIFEGETRWVECLTSSRKDLGHELLPADDGGPPAAALDIDDFELPPPPKDRKIERERELRSAGHPDPPARAAREEFLRKFLRPVVDEHNAAAAAARNAKLDRARLRAEGMSDIFDVEDHDLLTEIIPEDDVLIERYREERDPNAAPLPEGIVWSWREQPVDRHFYSSS